MILIADSGSTKTDWALVSGSQVSYLTTQGINPFHQTEETVLGVLRDELLPQMGAAEPDHIYFYGAGCNEQAAPRMAEYLINIFPNASVEAHSDLLGAARSLCGRGKGIACILGTGSNSCLYDGKKIVKNIAPLGYILGDEGSGAVIGRNFLNALLKEELPASLLKDFYARHQLTYGEIIDRVYRQPMANRFLASFLPYINEVRGQYDGVKAVVRDAFRSFVRKNIAKYARGYEVYAVGSVAFHFADLLREACAEEGYTLKSVEQKPIDGLVRYHGQSVQL